MSDVQTSKLPNSEARITPRHERLADFLRYVRQFGVESVGDHSITVPTSADRLGHAMFSWSMFEQCIEILKSAEQSEDDGCSFGRRVDPDTLANICDTHGKVCAEQSKDSAPMDGEREIDARVEAAKRYRRINGDSRWHAAIEDGFVAGAKWARQQTEQAFDDEDHLGSALMAWFLDYENEIRSNEQRETALGELSLRLKESNV